jgi:glutamyl-tRNA synthetase
MSDKVRVRFAPSPTGPLHIGGVRTALYNYLFAKKLNGKFILRIEDTDQTRYVEGAESYIKEALDWLGLTPDEGPAQGGDYGPYRQSERKEMYAKYALELVEKGHAYYAFDTSEELAKMRTDQEALGHHSAKYDRRTRSLMRNSLTLSEEETKSLIEKNENVIIRLKMPENETVTFNDIVREEVSFNTDELDDKVILKNDGMPTYHLANIVDDHLMEISHVIRGEEWLSSTAHHVLMYRAMGWTPPTYIHLPLILKPTGKGKLSKRDGAKFGFSVFPLQWNHGEDVYSGFREDGYNPAALLNFLVLLGWNPGNDEELMDMERMQTLFSPEKIVKSGARFDIDKAKWFNQNYIHKQSVEELLPIAKKILAENKVTTDDAFLTKYITLMQERITVYPDLYSEGKFFFQSPTEYEEKQVKKRYKPELDDNFNMIKSMIMEHGNDAAVLTDTVKSYLNDNDLKMGVYLPLLRVMMCGGMTGPDLFDIITTIGKEESVSRIDNALVAFKTITG